MTTDLSTSYKNRNTTQIAPKNTDAAQGSAPGASCSPCWVLASPGGQSVLSASSPETSAAAPLTSLGCVLSLLLSLCNLDALCLSTAVHAAFDGVKAPLLPPQDPPLSCHSPHTVPSPSPPRPRRQKSSDRGLQRARL